MPLYLAGRRNGKIGKGYTRELEIRVKSFVDCDNIKKVNNDMNRRKILAETNPELIKEWHPYKNGTLIPFDVTSGSGKKVWWLLPYDDPSTDKHSDYLNYMAVF